MFATGNDTIDKIALNVRTGLFDGLRFIRPADSIMSGSPAPLHNANAAETHIDLSDSSQIPLIRKSLGYVPFDFGVVNVGKPIVSLTDFLNDQVSERKASADQIVTFKTSTERLLGGGSENLKPAIKAQFDSQPVTASPAIVKVAKYIPPEREEQTAKGLNRPVNLPDVASPVAVAAVHKTKNTSFPLSYPVWQKTYTGQELQASADGGIADVMVGVGDYIVKFSVPDKTIAAALRSVDIAEDIPFKVAGKQCFLKKATFDPKTGKGKMWIRVEENIAFLLPLLIAGAAAVGFAGFGVSKTIDSVDKVVVDVTGNAWKLAVALAIGLGAWYGIPYFFKRKAA